MNRFLVAASTWVLLSPLAFADNVSATSSLSATVQVAGPRTGSSGTNFFNVEGSNNGNFSSYGVLDFNADDFNLAFTATSISNLSLSLTESNSSFTTALGALSFYLVTDTITSIANDGTSPLRFDSASAPNGFGTQLGAAPFLLGTGTFSTNSGSTGSGTVDTYSFTLSSDAQTYFLSQLNTEGAILRLVVAPNDATGASTWAGSTNSNAATRPKLSFNAIVDQPALDWIGGDGTWNATGDTNWSGGAWDSAKAAVFATGSGTVALGTPVTTSGIRFDVTGYTVTGTASNPLTLSSALGGNAISVSNAADTATISAVIAGTDGLQKNGDGTLSLGGANTFSGAVTINGGTLLVSNDSNFGASDNGIVMNGGALKSANTLNLNASRTLSGSGSLDASLGKITVAGSVNAATLAITGGNVEFAGLTAAFTSASLAAGSELTVSAFLTSSTRTTFSGDGTVNLAADNSAFTSGVSISRGAGTVGPTVVMGTAGSLGANTTFFNAGELKAAGTFTGANAITTAISLGGNVTVSGGDMEFSGAFGLFGTSAKRLTVLNHTTISTAITSAGNATGDALIKAGTGTLTLSGVNAYTGGTQILAGTLEVGSSGALGSGNITVAAENAVTATLRLDSNSAIDDLSNIFIINSLGMSQIDLNFDSSLFEVVNGLVINGIAIEAGDYDASDLPDFLTGTGNLRVLTTVPEPGTIALLLLGGALMISCRKRERLLS